MPATLVVTNDFPPRIGGIESFVAEVCRLLDGDVVVYTARAPGAAAYDRACPFPVIRAPGPLLPVPAVRRAVVEVLRRYGASRVIFGAAAPLGLLAGPLRAAGAARLVALSHGHEVWWAALPPSRLLLRRVADEVDHLTTISTYTARRIAPALSPSARVRLRRLPPPVDVDLFRPAPDGTRPERRRCIAVGRFVRQKGFDTLLRAWGLVQSRWPAGSPPPELVLVGDGPRAARLHAAARDPGLLSAVSFAGALPRPRVAAELQRADVFALPVRTRLGGLNPEGLGLAALEAAACGLPVLIGDSGGAPETVAPGDTGYVVASEDVAAWADHLTRLLRDPSRAAAMGRAGRERVARYYSTAAVRATLRGALGLDAD